MAGNARFGALWPKSHKLLVALPDKDSPERHETNADQLVGIYCGTEGGFQ